MAVHFGMLLMLPLICAGQSQLRGAADTVAEGRSHTKAQPSVQQFSIDEHQEVVNRNLAGLQAYFDAVSSQGLSHEDKLGKIAETFTENTVLVRPDGSELKGRAGVESFYGSPASPVMKMPDFKPKPVANTTSISEDGKTIAVEILLPLPGGKTSQVGDFFTFDDEGKISRVRIYSWPMA
eukprot:TRINITY_DN3967_c0_g1_i4.p1 TRINITY_DN3967_c0_g1~~TRINITY_DN3967_c0_g1_i4.p1  ORF type:complete len:180 (+),score=33.53 TRINITY_DN3967_c0_g1_i4:96-635(+)